MTAGGKLDRGCSGRVRGCPQGHPRPSGGARAEQRVRGRAWAPRADPARQRGREALGTEPRRGGSGTAPASGDPGADAESPGRGSEGGSGLDLPPAGACERGSWAGGSSFKGHCQRAALTTAERPPLTQSGESGSATSGCSRTGPDAPLALPAVGDRCPFTLSPCRRCCCELGGPCATCGDTSPRPR